MTTPYRRKQTNDPHARELNVMLDDVARGIQIGRWLLDLYTARFGCDNRKFRVWARQHVDRDLQSLVRKMVLAQHARELQQRQITRLADAYKMLRLTGSVTMNMLTAQDD